LIETFLMERMQSTWENLVDYDLSESGVRPLTLRELTNFGFDLDTFLDVPLGYSQSNGTLELREALAKVYLGATADHIEVTNGTSEANYIIAMALLKPGDGMALQVPNYMQLWGVPRSLGAEVATFPLRGDAAWEPDWDAFEKAVTPNTRLLYISNPNNPSGSILSDEAMRRIVERCEQTNTYLLSDEVYLGAEINRPRTRSFWGMSDRVIVASGLSKAYGIPGVRIGWIVGPKEFVAACWSQHDYLTIGPNKMSDRIALAAVRQRDALYARTGEILARNIHLIRDWVASFNGFLTWQEPAAGAIGLVRYHHDIPSIELADRIRERQSTLVVPGSHVGLEGYLRLWFGGKEEYLKEGLRRIGQELRSLQG
jgi:hypothetical protein